MCTKMYLSSLENIAFLSNEEQQMCDALQTIDSEEIAVKELTITKSPGIDGLSNEFYKKFWKDFDTLLYDAFKEMTLTLKKNHY